MKVLGVSVRSSPFMRPFWSCLSWEISKDVPDLEVCCDLFRFLTACFSRRLLGRIAWRARKYKLSVCRVGRKTTFVRGEERWTGNLRPSSLYRSSLNSVPSKCLNKNSIKIATFCRLPEKNCSSRLSYGTQNTIQKMYALHWWILWRI